MITIEQLINKALEPKPRESSGKWKPSSFGRCYRQQFWSRKAEPKSNPLDSRTLRVFAAGQLFHDFVQNLLEGEQEVQIECEDVKGFADIVRDNEVVDIKSQHSKAFWWMVKKEKMKGFDIKEEKYANWLQVLYYARELKKDFGRLVFVSKDDLSVQEYVQPLDEFWLAHIDIEISTLRRIWEMEELPPAEPRCEPNKAGEYWECNYCAFKNKCNELEKENENAKCK